MTDKRLSTCDELSEEMKQVDTCGLSFADLRRKDKYYVDKTLLVKDILGSNDSGVYLFTRPRRFGKTTNLSMLDAFFNEKYKGNTWFDGLEISNYPEYEKYRNSFPVIHLDMRASKSDTYEGFLGGMISTIATAFEPHQYLLEWEGLRKPVRDLFSMLDDRDVPEARLRESILLLSGALKKHSGKNVVILIDEYDSALADSYGDESHRPMLKFLRAFLGQTLKSNPNLEMAYMTGVMQIAQESIFSELNNVTVNNIFSDESDERFGFTESEVKDILEHYGHPEKLDEVREWYDGYRFGNVDVYNPFSIMNYIRTKFKADTYWTNSGGDGIVRHLLQRINSESLEDILNLAKGGTVRTKLMQQLTYGDVYASDESLFSLMAMTGYLNAVPAGNKDYEISIPNNEVMEIVYDLASKVGPVSSKDFVAFNRAVLDGDAEKIASISEKALDNMSYLNFGPETRENSYEVMMATLLVGVREKYTVRTQREMKLSRADIIMVPKARGDMGIVIEIKISKSVKGMDAGVNEAFKQIHDRSYFKDMPPGKVSLIGICFHSKLAEARTEIVEVPVG